MNESMSRLLPIYFTRDSFSSCLYDLPNPVWIFISKMLKFTCVIVYQVFSSFIGLERRLSDFLNIFWSILFDRSKGKKFSLKCYTGLQNFWICFRKSGASLSLSFAFRSNTSRPRCCELIFFDAFWL